MRPMHTYSNVMESTSNTKTGIEKWDRRFLRLAREVSSWSKDPSTSVGAVAVSPTGSPLSMAYNGFPRGIDDTNFRLNDRPTKYSLVCHAEANLIYNANYNGVSLNRSIVYVHGLPVCSECAKALIQVGVQRVIMTEVPMTNPAWIQSFELTKEMFAEAGIEYAFLDLTNEN